jgi:type II secretory pathway component PulM
MTRGLTAPGQRLRALGVRWRALPARDRLAAAAAGLVLALALLWLFAARPALDKRARWQRELPQLQAQAAELDRLLADAPTAPAPAGDALREPLQAGLDRAGLQGRYRIDTVVADAPAGAAPAPPATAWRIGFDAPVPAGQALSWLAEVAARGDVEVTAAALDRAAPDSVRGHVDLQSTSLNNKDGQ